MKANKTMIRRKALFLVMLTLALSSCANEHFRIEIEKRLTSDYSQIISEIRAVNAALTEKLAAIEQKMADGFADNAAALAAIKAAVASLEGTTTEKLAAVEAAVKAQTTSLETKLALVEAAVEAGFADSATAQGLIKEAITSLDGTMAEKLAAVEAAVKAQTASLETKLGLIEKAVETGYADNAAAQGLIKEAIASLEGTTAAKFAAIEAAVKSQASGLDTKLAAIETAVKEGFADSAAAQDLIKKALESLGGTADTRLAAIEKAVKDQTTSFGTKLDLIEAAINKGFADSAKAQGLIEQAIKTLDSNTAGKLAEILQKITGLPNYSGDLNDIKNAIDTLRKMFVLSVSLDKASLTMYVGARVPLTATVFPADATDKSVTWKSSDPAVAEVSPEGIVSAKAAGSAIITVTTSIGGNTAACTLTVKPGINGYEYVDLGFAVNGQSIKWATCNIGASSPEEYGDYFAWGEVEPNKSAGYTGASYAHTEGNTDQLTKYCGMESYGYNHFTDYLTTLELTDDAARHNWDGKWRMPTEAEFQALIVNCTITYEVLNGKHGVRFTSNVNSESIFLPAAGYLGPTGLSGDGSGGYYWSSSLEDYDPISARSLQFGSGVTVTPDIRYRGFPIRPVSGEPLKVPVTNVELRPLLTLPVNGSAKLVATVLPSDATDRSVTWKSSDPSAVEVSQDGTVTARKPGGTATITVTTTDGGKEATCTVTVNALVNGHECVDMGIEAGGQNIRWATMNVGATKPEEYGDYFAWGETEPDKSVGYTWETYKFRTEGDSWDNVKFYKYTTKDSYASSGKQDGISTLEKTDDAASVNWGGSWRMPTEAELKALADTKSDTQNYGWTWCNGSTEQYNNTSVTGWKIERKSTGATLFLPAAGYRGGAYLNSAGSGGYYWSSSLSTGSPSGARDLFFSSGTAITSGYLRYYGFPVRPVTD